MSCAVYSTIANLKVKDTLNEESEEKVHVQIIVMSVDWSNCKRRI